MKKICISTEGVPEDYRHSLVPLIVTHLGYAIEWTSKKKADLLIFGPFYQAKRKAEKWTPKPLRRFIYEKSIESLGKDGPLTLFQTAENLRHDHIKCDYSISFDLGIQSAHHYRLPYWMELVDWGHEGIKDNRNPRFGELLQLSRMTAPLGETFLKKKMRAAIFASHLREPRFTLVNALKTHLPVEGYGPYFDVSIRNHSHSNIRKKDVLRDYAINLCPENSMYPGYYTEKIAEAFVADCLPITWTDESVSVDFNPKAMINLAPMMKSNFRELSDILNTRKALAEIATEPLLTSCPSIEDFKKFIKKIASEALS